MLLLIEPKSHPSLGDRSFVFSCATHFVFVLQSSNLFSKLILCHQFQGFIYLFHFWFSVIIFVLPKATSGRYLWMFLVVTGGHILMTVGTEATPLFSPVITNFRMTPRPCCCCCCCRPLRSPVMLVWQIRSPRDTFNHEYLENNIHMFLPPMVLFYKAVIMPGLNKRVPRFAWNLKTGCPKCSLTTHLHVNDR